MFKPIHHLGIELLFQAPAFFALIFGGLSLYIGEFDPLVRAQLQNNKMQLKHWAKVWRVSRITMPYFAIISSITAFFACQKTKQTAWLYGIATLSLPLPFTVIAIIPLSKQLENILITTQQSELPQSLKEPVLKKIQSWVRRHRARTVLSLISAGIFIVAKQYSTTTN